MVCSKCGLIPLDMMTTVQKTWLQCDHVTSPLLLDMADVAKVRKPYH